MKKDILYPIFVKCMTFVEDPFWKYVYEDLGYGRCPYGLSIQKNCLYSYIKGKEFAYLLNTEKPVEESFQEIDTLLREKVGILSEKEKIMERMRLCRQRITVPHQKHNLQKKEEWTQVKRKMIRDTLLEQYVLVNTIHYKLSMETAKRVLSLLIVGLMFKTITARDIIYQNGFIHRVEGIQFEQGTFETTRNLLQCKPNPSIITEDSTSIRTLHSYWGVYLDELKLFK